MPYNKKYKRKRKRRSGYYRHGMNALELASKSLAVATTLKKLINVEFKFHDVQITATAVSTTATISQLTNIPQGDTDITRDGAQVKVTRLNLKYLLASHASAANTAVRLMLVLDKQTNGAIYAIADLLADTTANDIIVSGLNLDNKYRFRVLYNQVVLLNNEGWNNKYHVINKQLQQRLRFESSTPSIADLNSGSLSFVIVSNQTTNTPLVTMFSRIRYVDN